jgi:phosphohistidine phosphatase
MGKKFHNGKPYDQASAVPYRFRDGELELCLITTTGKRRWGFPKGIIDPGESEEETALKEAAEEAGLSGEVDGPPLGAYTYSKWGRTLRVQVLLMNVQYVAERWEEQRIRERSWVSPEKALELLDRRHLRKLVREAAKRLEVEVAQN